MIFAQRVISRDNWGEESEDFVGLTLPTAKPRAAKGGSPSAYDRRTIQLRAIKVLREQGFRTGEIAITLSMTERHIRNRLSELEKLADQLKVADE